MIQIALFISLGLAVGGLSGLIGIGGGVFFVPALVFLFGMQQHEAQGTTLALLVPPIGILGAWIYYKQGYVDIKIAACICLGFLLGSLLEARVATSLPTTVLERVFGVAMLAIALKMIWGK